MTTEEIKLKCIELVKSTNGFQQTDDLLKDADKLFDWITKGRTGLAGSVQKEMMTLHKKIP